MHLALIQNTDEKMAQAYQIARVVYAHTRASSLLAVEAMTSMIHNAAVVGNCRPIDIASDETLFEALRCDSSRHNLLNVAVSNRGFQMCLRVVQKMLRGNLADACYGATRFHYADSNPSWATARGYIADIDEILFYL